MKELLELEGTTILGFDRYINPDEYWKWFKIDSRKELEDLKKEIEQDFGETYLDAFESLERKNQIIYPVYICLNDDTYKNGFTQLLEDCINEAKNFFAKFNLTLEIKRKEEPNV